MNEATKASAELIDELAALRGRLGELEALERGRLAVTESLQERADVLRTISAAAQDAILMLDGEGRITYWNQAAERILGYTRQEALGEELHIFLTPSRYHEAYRAGFARFQQTGQGPAVGQTLELAAVRKDGTEFPIELSVSAVRLQERWHAVGVLRDITERKQAEEALRASEAQWRSLVENAPDIIMTVARDGTILFINRTPPGTTPPQAIGARIYDHVPAEFHPTMRAAIESVFDTGSPAGYDLAGPGPHGGTAWYATRVGPIVRDGQVVQVTLISTDITQRRREEQRQQAVHAVREAVGQLRGTEDIDQILTAVRDGLETTEVPFHWCGINLVEDDGDPPRVRFHNMSAAGDGRVSEHEQASRLSLEFWRAGVPVHRPDLAAEDRHGERVFTRDSQPPVRSVLDVPFTQGTLAVSSPEPQAFSEEDIVSVQRLAEVLSEGFRRLDDLRDLEAKDAQLRQSQKMEAVGQLAGGVAHDFNNLITIITGYCQVLLKRLGPDHPQQSSVEQISRAGEQAAALVRQLLAFSRRQLLEPQVLNLNQIVADVSKMLGRLLGEDIDLNEKLDPQLGHVCMDPGQLERVLVNLAANARDAMSGGGRLSLKTANIQVDKAYVQDQATVSPGSYVMLTVSDTGAGMDEATRSRIFEPFFTTKEPGRGTGLGLATVYGTIKQSEGYIWASSEPGRGTSFTVYLPRVEPSREGPAERPVPRATPRGSETILLVEDADPVRRLAYQTLRECGYEVLEAPGGDEALRLCGQHAEPVHLLLTDVVMPRMSGPDLAEQLAPLRPDLKVLYMSGYMNHETVRQGVLEGGLPLLQKPFTPASLARAVRGVLGASPPDRA